MSLFENTEYYVEHVRFMMKKMMVDVMHEHAIWDDENFFPLLRKLRDLELNVNCAIGPAPERSQPNVEPAERIRACEDRPG